MTSPGQEAMHEAMRLESARIYGQLQREHKAPVEAAEHTVVKLRVVKGVA